MARFHDVWVLTRRNNRPPIQAELDGRLAPSLHFVYFDLPYWARFWKRSTFGLRLYYCLWQIGVLRVAIRLNRTLKFDLVHHVTFVNYWLPTWLGLLPVPFIWGPVGGGESMPRQFRSLFGFKPYLLECLRDGIRKLSHVVPVVRFTAKRAAYALATTSETEQELKSIGCRKTMLLSQVALPAEEISQLGSVLAPPQFPFRILSMGRLIYWKGFTLALKAFAEFQQRVPDSEYWLVGDGPEKKRLAELCNKLGVTSRVRLIPQMSRTDALKTIGDCHVLVHPSLHDSGAYVCLEAMAAGRPVVCLDLGGPAVQVNSLTGYRVPVHSAEQVVRDLADSLTTLAANPELRSRMGRVARDRVQQHFAWDRKGEWMNEIYSLATPKSNLDQEGEQIGSP